MNTFKAVRYALASMAVLLACGRTAAGDTINVPGDQSTIQGAIDVAVNGDEIIVGPGVYGEISFDGKSLVIRSSGGPAVTTIDAGGVSHVVDLNNGEGGLTLLDGFTITGGSANSGAGIRVGGGGGGGTAPTSIGPTIRDCVIIGNAGVSHGGAGRVNGGNPRFEDCHFEDNTAQEAGALLINQGTTTLVRCTFQSNDTSVGDGGALLVANDASIVAVGCTFVANTSTGYGGAVFVESTAFSELHGCCFIGNVAGERGGAVSLDSSEVSIVNAVFSGNTAQRGGALRTRGGSMLDVLNSSFGGNSATQNIGNLLRTDGGPDKVMFSNCIMWGNGDPGNLFSGASPNVISTIVENIDPMFVDADGADATVGTIDDDLRLLAGSPAIDAGDTTLLQCAVPDRDGHERIVDDPATADTGSGGPPVVDLGAYEFGAVPAVITDCDGNGVPDACESNSFDCDSNGVLDICEFVDCDGNSEHDPCDVAMGSTPDCNGNGVPDSCDIAFGTSDDCDNNGAPDECDPDCNQNGFPDACDIAGGTSIDCNGNGVPDACDVESGSVPDCNGNGIPDSCDIQSGAATDCNGNGVPDACDVESGSVPDCNGNGIPDSCDIQSGAAMDCNDNGVPDDCDAPGGTPGKCGVHNVTAGTFHVTIQEAIDQAQTGHEIVVGPGTWNESFSMSTSLILRSSEGPDSTTLTSAGPITATITASTFQLLGFTIRNTAGRSVTVETTTDGLVRGCRFDETGGGAALVIANATVDVINCRFEGLIVDPKASDAPLTIGGLADVTVRDCDFTGNSAANLFNSGAILAVQASSVRIVSCDFLDTATTGHEIVMADSLNAMSVIDNCLFQPNRAVPGYVEVIGPPTSIALNNCTFIGLFAILDLPPGSSISNSILSSSALSVDPDTTVTDSCNFGGAPEDGNIIADPLFVNPATGDYRLTESSPCINGSGPLPPDTADVDGDGDTLEPLPLDLDRRDRTFGDSADMGAYERGCIGDVDFNGIPNVDDIITVILDWGCTWPSDCTGDANGDGTVNVDDLVRVILAWGPCG